MTCQIKLLLAYDGTRYLGWQKTRMGPSIQESLAKALTQITGEQILPEAASRTDRGVHAQGQVVAFSLHSPPPLLQLQKGLNAVLPADIRVLELKPISAHFHPTLDAVGKEYHYQICLGEVQEPIHRLYSWHVYSPLDLQKMESAASDLLGTHDFTAFTNEIRNDPVCTLKSIAITPSGNRLQIAFRGNRFLYKMVRNLAGTLVYIGCGKLPPNCIPSLFASRDRKQAGMTAPAHGLYLHKVVYDTMLSL